MMLTMFCVWKWILEKQKELAQKEDVCDMIQFYANEMTKRDRVVLELSGISFFLMMVTKTRIFPTLRSFVEMNEKMNKKSIANALYGRGRIDEKKSVEDEISYQYKQQTWDSSRTSTKKNWEHHSSDCHHYWLTSLDKHLTLERQNLPV